MYGYYIIYYILQYCVKVQKSARKSWRFCNYVYEVQTYYSLVVAPKFL